MDLFGGELEGQMPLWGPGSRGGVVKTPRATPAGDSTKPVWSRLTLKSPPACFRCVRGAHGGRTGPVRHARWRRVTGDKIEDFCNLCAEDEKAEAVAAEKRAEAEKLAASRPTRRRSNRKGSGR